MLDIETSFSARCITLRAVEFLAGDVNHGASGQSSDVAIDEFHRAASEDPAFSELLQCVRAGFPRDRYTLPNVVSPYWKLRDNLYNEDDLVLYGARVVIHAALCHRVLARLHDRHRGAEATKRRARQVVYCLGIDSESRVCLRTMSDTATKLATRAPKMRWQRTYPVLWVSVSRFLQRSLEDLSSYRRPSPWMACSATIQSVLKKGDSSNPSNYRPIVLISCLSKVFESLFKRKIQMNPLFTSFYLIVSVASDLDTLLAI